VGKLFIAISKVTLWRADFSTRNPPHNNTVLKHMDRSVWAVRETVVLASKVCKSARSAGVCVCVPVLGCHRLVNHTHTKIDYRLFLSYKYNLLSCRYTVGCTL